MSQKTPASNTVYSASPEEAVAKVAEKVIFTFAVRAVYPDGWIENEPLQGEWKPPLQNIKKPKEAQADTT